MKLILKNNYIYLPSNDIIINNSAVICEVKVLDIVNTSDFIFTAIINNSEHIVFEGSFEIPYDQLNVKMLQLTITAISKDGKYKYEYVADSYPITKAILLGSPATEWYPGAINQLTERVSLLEVSDKIQNDDLELHKQHLTTHDSDIKTLQNDLNIAEHAIIEIKNEGEIV